MMRRKFFDVARKAVWLPWVAALAGMALYLQQAFYWATHQRSMVDEGAYLYKGYLFATGKYIPYQPYGPWTNHMPLAFLIPGYIQKWFGPGLRTGRYFAIFVAVMMLIGLWLVTRRLTGSWWAVFAVWAVALNPAMIKVYSLAISEGLAACLLIWVLVFGVGDERKDWELTVAGVLSGILTLTRVNMAPVVPLFLAYSFWQHGSRKGWISTSGACGILLLGHAIYWPGILDRWNIWLSWIPGFYKLAGLKTDFGTAAWHASSGLMTILMAWSNGLRFYFLSIAGGTLISILIILESRKNIREKKNYTFFFLAVTWIVLLLSHMLGGVLGGTGAYTFIVYPAFFAPLGILLCAYYFTTEPVDLPRYVNGVATTLVIVLWTMVGFSSYQNVSPWLMKIKIPRIRIWFSTGQRLPGHSWWGILTNKFGVPYKAVFRWTPMIIIGILSLLVVLVIWFLCKKNKLSNAPFLHILILVFIMPGFFITSTSILGNGFNEYDCRNSNVILAYEQAGNILQKLVPPKSLVYWTGEDSVVLLLSLPKVSSFPPQYNNEFAHRIGGDNDKLLGVGFWNNSINEQWKKQANVILISKQRMDQAWKIFLDTDFTETGKTNEILACRHGTDIYVYVRNQQP